MAGQAQRHSEKVCKLCRNVILMTVFGKTRLVSLHVQTDNPRLLQNISLEFVGQSKGLHGPLEQVTDTESCS